MTIQLTTPGVYVQELSATPSSASGIVGVSTSIAAFVGATASGPLMQPTLLSSWADYQQQFGALAWQAMVSWSVNQFFLGGGTSCYVVRADDLAHGVPASATVGGQAFCAAMPGTWGNDLAVAVSATGADFSVSVLLNPRTTDALWQAYIGNNALAQHSTNGTTALGRHSARRSTWLVLEQFAGLAANTWAAQVNAQSLFLRVPAPQPSAPPVCDPTPLAGGTQPRYDFPAATALLDHAPEVSLLAVPDIVTATDATGQASLAQQAALIQAGLQYCEARTSVFYVADAPLGLDTAAMLAFKTGAGTGPNSSPNSSPIALASTMGAIYYPWVYVYHAATASNVPIPPCGPVLGRYAYTDTAIGVFRSPAGVNDGALSTVVALERKVTDADQDLLNPAGINCIRTFINYGNVIWGARTLSVNPDWVYVNVRRLCIYVEQSIQQSLQWVVFESNDPALWARVSMQVSAFLTNLWQQGGLFGGSSKEAFFVICDATNNPPDSQLAGQLNLQVGLAPVFPAEFVVLSFQMKTAGGNAG